MDQPGKVANPARGQSNRENNILLSPCVPENLVSRDGFSRPVPRQPAHLHTQAESGAYLRDSSRVKSSVKTFRWDHRLQIIQNLFMAINRVIFPDGSSNIGSNVGEKLAVILFYTYFTLITMQGQQFEQNKDKRKVR